MISKKSCLNFLIKIKNTDCLRKVKIYLLLIILDLKIIFYIKKDFKDVIIENQIQ